MGRLRGHDHGGNGGNGGRIETSGMAVATVLTLFFVPYLYARLDDLRLAGARWAAFAWPRKTAPP